MPLIDALVERLRAASPQRLLLVGEAGHRYGAALQAAIEATWPAPGPVLVRMDQLRGNPPPAPAMPDPDSGVRPGVHPDAAPDGRPDTRLEAAVLTVDDRTPALDVVLGEACRRFPACLLVEHRTAAEPSPGHPPVDSNIHSEQFFALGFLRRCSVLDGPLRCTLYEYCLRDYKPAPAWLNARYWANPERFSCDPDE